MRPVISGSCSGANRCSAHEQGTGKSPLFGCLRHCQTEIDGGQPRPHCRRRSGDAGGFDGRRFHLSENWVGLINEADLGSPCWLADDPMPPLHKMKRDKVTLSLEHKAKLLELLKDPFEKHLDRHNDMEWAKVQARLEANPDKLWSLSELERTGGELDVVGHDKKTGEYIFFDSSAETPKGRGVFAITAKGGNPATSIGREQPPWIWPRPWA